MTHSMFLQFLVEAETRRDDKTLPQEVRDRSAETVDLFNQRMSHEGLTRTQLEEFAKAEA